MPSLSYDSIRRYGLEDVHRSFPDDRLQEMEAAREGLLAGPVILAADDVALYFEKHEAGFPTISPVIVRTWPRRSRVLSLSRPQTPVSSMRCQEHTPSKGLSGRAVGTVPEEQGFRRDGRRVGKRGRHRRPCDGVRQGVRQGIRQGVRQLSYQNEHPARYGGDPGEVAGLRNQHSRHDSPDLGHDRPRFERGRTPPATAVSLQPDSP